MEAKMAGEEASNIEAKMAGEETSKKEAKMDKQETSDPKVTTSIIQQAYESLQSEKKNINIFGSSRAGKTQMSKKLCYRAKIKKLFDFTLWVYMTRNYTPESLTMSLARQLDLIPVNDDWEVEEADNNQQKRERDSDDHDRAPADDPPPPTTETLNKCIVDTLKGKKILVVLEDVVSDKTESSIEKEFWQVWEQVLPPSSVNLTVRKLLISRLKWGDNDNEGFDAFEVPKSLAGREQPHISLRNVIPIGVLKDLWWRGKHFYRDSGSVHYSELITYWILEGYLGAGSMTKLYRKGHGVLMELIDYGVLKVQEGGYVFMDKSLVDDRDLYQAVEQNPSLGLATLINSEDEGVGKITHSNGMLKTTPTARRRKKDEPVLWTLLLDGTHATDRVITRFLECETKLKVFGLFYPTIQSLPKALETIAGLRVLVLRGCEFLTEAKISLNALEVLEISDARNLRKLNSGFFKNMLNLKSLHLSGLQITTLPQAIYSLEKIQWLIVRDCRRLKKLESISKLVDLIVVDLSGNISLETLDKNFLKFNNLQSLNLSKTMVSTTPLLKNRKELTHLLCSECPDLVRLRGLTSLTSLQTIDLSGSKNFQEFHDMSLQSLTSLISLNLSGTGIDHLPSNISKPRYLYLKNCLELQRLACFVSLTNLEVLDLSGSTNLNIIEDKFFDDMKSLRVLNLSETSISCLPSLSNLSSLQELYLSNCRLLTTLPSLESSTKLDTLDASNCIALQNIETKSFESMTQLQKMDFSDTMIVSLPSLPNQCNLRQLLLKNCKSLKNLEELNGQFLHLEELNLSGITSLKPNGVDFVKDASNLRVLDLSDTSIKELPSMSKLTNLTSLFLAGCLFSSKTQLDYPNIKIQVLDLSRSTIEIFPIFDYTNLQKLMLKDCSMKQKPDDAIYTYPHLDYIEYPDIACSTEPEQWNICQLSDTDKSPVFLNTNQFVKKSDFTQQSYHLCAVPAKVGSETWDTYLQRHELVFQDVYLQNYGFAYHHTANKSLQIRGFNQFPKGIENIVNDIDSLLLIDYKLKGFQSCFDPSTFNNLKGCWIERCNEMVTIFEDQKEGNNNPGLNIPLVSLGLCNNIQLKSIYGENQPSRGLDTLKSLYIENCPMFSSSWLPKNLELLEVRYCDMIFESECEFPESLQSLKIWECRKVKQLEDQFEIPKGLKTLCISGAASLKNFVTKNNENINLETLKVENCAMLEYLISSGLQLACIQVIEIRSCEKMKTFCTDINRRNATWLKLKKLRLQDVPMLKDFGVQFECQDMQLHTVD
ncbi:hypothetical protein QVD17_16333 [Tagetes erecta]|uniref:NB-ARC domain-containing protein n=1 Tax=Tagetes erecta TaxID=13708 RepID=A0AAD8KRA2_TARER|nr:hypothetical protein QVD17_16333 [Tagetes erecta]